VKFSHVHSHMGVNHLICSVLQWQVPCWWSVVTHSSYSTHGSRLACAKCCCMCSECSVGNSWVSCTVWILFLLSHNRVYSLCYRTFVSTACTTVEIVFHHLQCDANLAQFCSMWLILQCRGTPHTFW